MSMYINVDLALPTFMQDDRFTQAIRDKINEIETKG